MPEPLTEYQARSKVCPFMSRMVPVESDRHIAEFAPAMCVGSACACWGWVERGEPGYELEYAEGSAKPAGDGWFLSSGEGRWARNKAIGPRHGRCEAGAAP
jgi:hypothetical protein